MLLRPGCRLISCAARADRRYSSYTSKRVISNASASLMSPSPRALCAAARSPSTSPPAQLGQLFASTRWLNPLLRVAKANPRGLDGLYGRTREALTTRAATVVGWKMLCDHRLV